MSDTANGDKSQLDKFKDTARELECDDDEKHFKEMIGRLTKVKPKQDQDK